MQPELNTIFKASVVSDLIFVGVFTLWVFALYGVARLIMPFVYWLARKLDSHE